MHRSRSSGVGLLSGGAQRTAAATYASRSTSPSSRASERGWLANPVRCIDANSQSPERSPVNTRPVRFPPCAAGARPTTSNRAAGSPNPGTGRPQYSSCRKRGALLVRDLLPPRDEPWARTTVDDLALDGVERALGRGHAGIVREPVEVSGGEHG